MTFNAVSADGGGGMFPQHPRSGPWETLTGGTLAPHIAQPLVSSNTGEARFNGTTPGTHASVKTYIVSTGMTRGGGTMAK
jgi:hypothetical protein